MVAPMSIGVGKPVVLVDDTSLPISFWYSICSAVMPAVLVSPFTVSVAKYHTTITTNRITTDSMPARRSREARIGIRRAS